MVVMMSVCLLVRPHSPPPITLSVLANSHQIWQEVEVSKTIKFLQIFLWLLNSAGRGGERRELVLTPRGKRQPSSALATSLWQWPAASPTAAPSGPRQPWARCQASTAGCGARLGCWGMPEGRWCRDG